MTYDLIEQSIIDRLEPLRSASLLVRTLPDTNAEYGNVRTGQVLLYLDAEQPSPSASMGRFIQQVQQTWVLDIRLRQMRKHNSEAVWAVLKLVRGLLIGFQPNGASSKISLGQLRFVGVQGEANYWTWEQRLNVSALVEEVAEVEQQEVLLRRIDYLFALEYSDGTATDYPVETLTVLSEFYEE